MQVGALIALLRGVTLPFLAWISAESTNMPNTNERIPESHESLADSNVREICSRGEAASFSVTECSTSERAGSPPVDCLLNRRRKIDCSDARSLLYGRPPPELALTLLTDAIDGRGTIRPTRR
jgi:hypothetical protein